MISSLVREFEASTDRWRVSRRLAIAMLVVPWLGMAVLAALFFISRPVFRFLMNEDQIIEWAHFACFAACVFAGAWIAAHRFRHGHPWQGALYAFFALAMVFIAGEDISWGQRLLGLETPPELEAINEQREISIHNIRGVLFYFNMTMLATSVYAMLAEPIGRRLGVGRRWADADRLFLPPFFLVGSFAFTAAFLAIREWVITIESYAISRLAEWTAMVYAAALLFFVLLVVRYLATERTGSEATSAKPSPQAT